MMILPKKRSSALIILILLFASVLWVGCASLTGQPFLLTGQPFPTGEWPTSPPENQGMHSRLLADMMDEINDNSYHIDSVSVVRNGHLVLDAYYSPFPKGKKHIIHSCTKSVMSALIGIAIDQGYLRSIDQPITDFFPPETTAGMDDLKKSITLENLLTMTSGLKCRDSYKYQWSGLWEMKLSDNWADHVIGLPMEATPGETFEYCNGVSYLLSVIIQNSTGMQTLDFARKNLFGPLGITEVGWDTSPQGVDIGWGEMWLTPHDMAKFGWLYLNKGNWRGKQIIPAAWVAASTRSHIATDLFSGYGYQWWVDSEEYYMAVGYKGQRIYVVPGKNMVVVFTGDLTGRYALLAQQLLNRYILQAAVSLDPLPPEAKEQARLAALVHDAAQEAQDGHTWNSASEGSAKDGLFTRTATPAFKFRYPMGSMKSALKYPGQIMRMKSLGDMEFSAFVSNIPTGTPLEAFAARRYIPALERFGSKVEITSHRKVTLSCGTPAYRTNIKWLWNYKVPITTLLVSAYKEGKLVYISAHPARSVMYAESIVDSLTFK